MCNTIKNITGGTLTLAALARAFLIHFFVLRETPPCLPEVLKPIRSKLMFSFRQFANSLEIWKAGESANQRKRRVKNAVSSANARRHLLV